MRSTKESSLGKSLSPFVVGNGVKELMEEYLIIFYKLSVFEGSIHEKTTVGAGTPAENKVEGIWTPLAKSQTYLTPPEVIAGVATHFKWRRVSTLIEFGVPVLIIEAHVVDFLCLNFQL